MMATAGGGSGEGAAGPWFTATAGGGSGEGAAGPWFTATAGGGSGEGAAGPWFTATAGGGRGDGAAGPWFTDASAVPAKDVAITVRTSEGVTSFNFDISNFSLGEREFALT